jgi:hypothetical protein
MGKSRYNSKSEMKNFPSLKNAVRIPRKNKNEECKRFRGKKKRDSSIGSPEKLDINQTQESFRKSVSPKIKYNDPRLSQLTIKMNQEAE